MNILNEDKLQYLWNNIISMYSKKGENYNLLFYSYGYCVLNIDSVDNYFECKIYDLSDSKKTIKREFKISIEHSLISDSQIYLEDYTDLGGIDGIIEYLKPLFREFKIDLIKSI